MCGQSALASGSTNIFSSKNIRQAYLSCRRKKRNTVNALKFEFNLADNLLKLERELNDKSYAPSRSLCGPTCRGLCPTCGKDLNEGDCNCADSRIDPRLAGLKDLLP